MNTKTINLSQEKKIAVADQIVDELAKETNSFDVIIYAEDNAVLYIPMRGIAPKIPSVFCGLDGIPEFYNNTYHLWNSYERPGKNLTGVFTPLLVPETALILKEAIPEILGKKMVVVFDNTTTGTIMIERFKFESQQSDLGIVFEFLQVSTFEEFKDLVLNYINKEEDIKAWYFGTFSLITTAGEPNIPAGGIIEWTLKNSKKPEMACAGFFCEKGLFGSVGNDVLRMGEAAGRQAGMILGGKSASEIPLQMKLFYQIFFSIDRIKTLKINVPDSVLKRAITYETPLEKEDILSKILVYISIGMFCVVLVIGYAMFFVFSISVKIIRRVKKKMATLTKVVDKISYLDLKSLEVENFLLQKNKSKNEKVLEKIVQNLLRFIPFIPQSFYATNDQTSIEAVCSHIDKTDSDKTHSVSQLSDYSNTDSSNDSSCSTKRSLSASIETKVKKEKLELKLTSKVVTILGLKVINLETFVQEILSLESFFNLIISTVSNTARKFNGVVINHSLDNIMFITWNAASVNVEQGKRGCFCALEIIKELEKKCLEEFGKNIKLSIAVVVGNSLVGNVGCSLFKSFGLFDYAKEKTIKQLFLILKKNEVFKTKLMVNEECFSRVKFAFFYRKIDVIENVLYVEIVDSFMQEKVLNPGNSEWMYLLSEKEEKNPFVEYNKSFDCYTDTSLDKISEGEAHLDDYMGKYPGCLHARRLSVMLNKKKDL